MPELSGPLENAAMAVLWQSGGTELSVTQVRERLSYDRPLAYTTLQTVMGILVGKGVVKRAKWGNKWFYRAASTREMHYAELLHELLDRSGHRTRTLEFFVQHCGADDRADLHHALNAIDPHAEHGPGAP